jgi:hypothetical protein
MRVMEINTTLNITITNELEGREVPLFQDDNPVFPVMD